MAGAGTMTEIGEMTGGEPERPDPQLSANVYSAGRLSDVIHRVVAPTWSAVRTEIAGDDGASSDPAEETGGYLWLMRYARGGEHLKLRLHGGKRLEEAFRESFPKAIDRYFANLPDLAEDESRLSLPQATPIDEEDHANDERPDRTFCWTRYRRSPISLGAGPYLENTALVAALTRSLARGTEIVLERLRTDEEGQAPFGQVLGTLLEIVIAGLGTAPFSASDRDRAAYLRYHRDWLLRSALKYGRSGGGARKMADTLDQFNHRVEALGTQPGLIGNQARRRWSAPDTQPGSSNVGRFEVAVANLFDRLEPVISERRFNIDPFAGTPHFPPLFRVLHGVANQLGINSLNEAFSHHLLLQVATDSEMKDQPVALSPEL